MNPLRSPRIAWVAATAGAFALGCGGGDGEGAPSDDAAAETSSDVGLDVTADIADAASEVSGDASLEVSSDAASDVGADGAPLGCPGLAPIVEPSEQVYVAPTGDDKAAGTLAAPLKTLGAAAKKLPTGGTIVVRGGTYLSQPSFTATGSVGYPLVIRPATGESPIFEGTDVKGSWSSVISLGDAAHVILEGLEIRNCTAPSCEGVSAGVVNDLTLRDLHVHHMDGSAARFAGKTIRFERNHFHDVALTNVDNVAYPSGGWPTCMGTTPNRADATHPWADDVVIRDNRIENCWGEGIGLWYASNAIVEGNTVVNSFNVGIYMDNAFSVKVSRNYVQLARGAKGGTGSGILMGSEPYTSWGLASAASHDIAITDDVVVAGGGIGWWSSDLATNENTYARVDVLHNTVVGVGHGALSFDAVGAGRPVPSAITVKNNVFSEKSGAYVGNTAGWTFAGNAWLNEAVPKLAGAADASVTLTVGPVGAATDVQPWASKVGAGVAGSGVPSDFLCVVRDPSHPTRGAFER